jgi:hypothetical protein
MSFGLKIVKETVHFFNRTPEEVPNTLSQRATTFAALSSFDSRIWNGSPSKSFSVAFDSFTKQQQNTYELWRENEALGHIYKQGMLAVMLLGIFEFAIPAGCIQ